MTFTTKSTAKISAKYSDSAAKITFDGVTNSDDITPEIAKTQIDKILAIVGKACTASGMIRTITQEAI